MENLPNELIMQTITFLPLKSLISTRGVNHKWRTMVGLSNILPGRRALLNLYLDAVESPQFQSARSTVLANLHSFDRDSYLNALTKLGLSISEEFHLWVMEWPERAVLGWSWPGLDSDFFMGDTEARPYGRNWLCADFVPAKTSMVEVPVLSTDIDEEQEMVKLNALEIWEHGCGWSTWLIMDETSVSWNGKMCCMEGGEAGDHPGTRTSSWVEWLRRRGFGGAIEDEDDSFF